MIRVLGRCLGKRGFPVLAIDLVGFGESDDPDLPLPEGFRSEDAVASFVRLAWEEGWVGPEGILYVGHSLGAGVVLRAGRLDPCPRAIVAIGGPTMHDWTQRQGPAWLRHFAHERFDDMGLGPVADDASLRVMERYLLEMDPIEAIAHLEGVISILLIYGEQEDTKIRTLSPPSPAARYALHVVPGAPHAFRCERLARGMILLYDRAMLESIVHAIEEIAS